MSDQWITREEMSEIREISSKLLKIIVTFMENPLAYADKLQEANGLLASLMEIANELGLDGDNLPIEHWTYSEQPLSFADLIIQTATDKFKEILRGE